MRKPTPLQRNLLSRNVVGDILRRSAARHPKISDVAVIGPADEVWGEAITAVVVPAPGENLDEQHVIARCKENMARYKVPKKVFVTDALPRNQSGKVLKRDLREKYST